MLKCRDKEVQLSADEWIGSTEKKNASEPLSPNFFCTTVVRVLFHKLNLAYFLLCDLYSAVLVTGPTERHEIEPCKQYYKPPPPPPPCAYCKPQFHIHQA